MTPALVALALAACFGAPEPVTIRGYDGHAMEPFISRDGATLFFNSRNGPRDQTDIYWARRINDTTFDFAGPLAGANSDKLDGVPTLSRDGAFAMISVRAVAEQGATVWTGAWDGRVVHGLALQRVLSPGPLPLFNMDIEMSADGRRLYFTDNRWSPFGPPSTSDFHLAVRENGAWRRAPEFDSWFDRINTKALEYAAGISADERELYFTRTTLRFLAPPRLEIMVATRPDARSPFSAPARIASISGFVEGPTVAPDGSLYYHAKVDRGLHRIYRVARTCQRP
ncbi:MAG: hypothetical protein SGJ23_12250 [Alphaproteobacteria bacterium]|nr:hypothetical protein [Alphaproteobacteria bacterium]